MHGLFVRGLLLVAFVLQRDDPLFNIEPALFDVGDLGVPLHQVVVLYRLVLLQLFIQALALPDGPLFIVRLALHLGLHCGGRLFQVKPGDAFRLYGFIFAALFDGENLFEHGARSSHRGQI